MQPEIQKIMFFVLVLAFSGLAFIGCVGLLFKFVPYFFKGFKKISSEDALLFAKYYDRYDDVKYKICDCKFYHIRYFKFRKIQKCVKKIIKKNEKFKSECVLYRLFNLNEKKR